MDDFRKYATKHLGMNSLVLDDVIKSQAGYLNPYILEERQLNVTQLDVFSRLMMDRIIFLGTQIDDYTANTLQAQLLYLDSVDPGKDISIYINSPGGSVYAGLGIYDTMQFISSDVATICTGMAASMAAVLLVAGAEGKRSALTHSRVMIHQPMGGAQGQASDIEITAREIQKLKKELYTIIADHSHTPFDKVWADSDRDYWMTAQEAKEYGLNVELIATDFPNLMNIKADPTAYEAYLIGYGVDSVDPDLVAFGFVDYYAECPEAVDLINEAGKEQDQDKRIELYAQAAELVKTAPTSIMTLYCQEKAYAYRDTIENYAAGTFNNFYRIHEWKMAE